MEKQQKQPTAEHYQGVVNRLSAKVASLTVENSSLSQTIAELSARINELEAQAAPQQENKDSSAAG